MKHLLPVLEGSIFPVMAKCISSDGQDVLEDVLELLASFTYFGGGSDRTAAGCGAGAAGRPLRLPVCQTDRVPVTGYEHCCMLLVFWLAAVRVFGLSRTWACSAVIG